MDISSNSYVNDDLNTENTITLDNAKDLVKKEAADKLEIMLGMTSTVTFDTSVLTRAKTTEKPAKLITILVSSAKFMLESQ